MGPGKGQISLPLALGDLKNLDLFDVFKLHVGGWLR